MKSWLYRYRTNVFVKNTLSVTMGALISQAFPLLFYPFFSRIFAPEEFGLLATINSITGIFVVVSTGKYEQAILVAKTENEVSGLVRIALLLSLTVNVALMILLVAIPQVYFEAWGMSEVKGLFWLPSLMTLSIVVYNVYNELCVRGTFFKPLTKNRINNSVLHTSGKLIFGTTVNLSNGLIWGDFLGKFISACICFFKLIQMDRFFFVRQSITSMKVIGMKYKEFPKFVLPDQVLNAFGVSFPVLYITSVFGIETVGQYSITMQILAIPISMLSLGIRDVFRQKVYKDFENFGSFSKIFLSTLGTLFVFGGIMSIALISFVPKLFEIVLGADWIVAGYYAQILLPMMFLNFVSMSMSGVFLVVGKFKESLYWQIYYSAITVLSLWLGYVNTGNPEGTLVYFAIGRASAYVIYLYLTFRYSQGT